MSERLGPLTFGKREEQIFLGREIAQHQDYSEQTAIEIDAEVKRIVMANYERAKKILLEHIEKLKVIALALLEHETLDAGAIDTLMAGGTLPPRKLPETATAAPGKQLEAKKDKRPGLFAPQPVPALKEDPEKA